jgi:hypothetical protein
MKKADVLTGVQENHRNPRSLLRSILIVLEYLISFLLLDFITKQFESVPGHRHLVSACRVDLRPAVGVRCALHACRDPGFILQQRIHPAHAQGF